MTYQLPSHQDFWFLPLGGANEIGMNLNVYGYNKQWLIVDLGISFYDRLGIEVLSPDVSFLHQQKENIAGLVITHGHEDHVGALPYLWPYLQCPVYATPFTMKIIKQKISDKEWQHQVPLHEIPLSGQFNVGDFKVEFITLTHSIPEPNALSIKTPHGTVIHTGDWKIDPNPLVGSATDVNRLEEIGREGVSALVCDSTNVFYEGTAGSEQDVKDNLSQMIRKYRKSRLTVTCFASNLARIQSIAQAAHEEGRYVTLLGKSLYRMVKAAQESGYLNNVPNFITDEQAMDLPYEKVLFICTGSQGEHRSALARIASGQHPVVSFNQHDIVIYSSRVIPGNEKSISHVQNNLIHLGVTVLSSHDELHVSGHPARDDLKQMYEWTRPKALIPVHGDAMHLVEHASFARSQGIMDVVIPKNGALIQLNSESPKTIAHIENGRWALDGYRMISLNSKIIKDRQKISIEGVVFVTLVIDSLGQLVQIPQCDLIGIVDKEDEIKVIENEIHQHLRNTMMTGFKNTTERENSIKGMIRKIISYRYGKKPVVRAHIVSTPY